jgi:hypothetical protein
MIPMIPMLAVIRLGASRRFSLYLPLFLVWLLLLPLVLLALPFVILATLLFGLMPLRIVGAGYALLASVRGMHVEVRHPHTHVFMHVY